MERYIIGEDEAREILKPHYSDIWTTFEKGFKTYSDVHRILKEQDGGIHASLASICKSVQVWNYSLNYGKNLLCPKGIDYLELSKSSRWFNFDDLIYMRFKKLDDNLRPSNVETDRIKLMHSQLQIPGFPDKPTIVSAGYTTDKHFSAINNVFIVCWRNGTIRWRIDLRRENEQQLSFYNNQEKAQSNVKSILKLKEEFKKQKTTNTNAKTS